MDSADMMPSVRIVAGVVSVAGTLAATATGAAELAAGMAVAGAGAVATSALGAPGQVATAVAGAAVSAAGTASQTTLGAVTTAANMVVAGSKVAEMLPSPGTILGGGKAGAQPPGEAQMGLPPALLPSVPTGGRDPPPFGHLSISSLASQQKPQPEPEKSNA